MLPSWIIVIIVTVPCVTIAILGYFIFGRKSSVGTIHGDTEKGVHTLTRTKTSSSSTLYPRVEKPEEPEEPEEPVFSDKLEVEEDEMYSSYLNISQPDLELEENKKFYANIQQKAATIKTTLRQSLRRKPTLPSQPIQLLFEQNIRPSLESSQPRPSLQTTRSVSSKEEDSTKIMIESPETISLETIYSTTNTPHIPSIPHSHASSHSSHSIPLDNHQPLTTQEIASAARRVIRTASKKSRTRSMLVTHEDYTFKEPQSKYATVRHTKQPTQNVDTIRRMLQSSWSGYHLKESGSTTSFHPI
ncbi:hypothetical protein BDB01DRAFT_854620 [Pilobolus umbonatus]|nr:hypothetical protein BDB01DRAFT_854620 [Pilobolus umbonatus]